MATTPSLQTNHLTGTGLARTTTTTTTTPYGTTTSIPGTSTYVLPACASGNQHTSAPQHGMDTAEKSS